MKPTQTPSSTVQQPDDDDDAVPHPHPHQEEEEAQTTSATVKKPKHSAPPNHNQHVADPLAHFLAIPWTARLLTDPAALDIVVSDRRPLASGDTQFVRSLLNSATAVRACVTFFLKLPPSLSSSSSSSSSSQKGGGGGGGVVQGEEEEEEEGISKSKALLRGGGPEDGEDPERPFLLFNALLDLGEDLWGFRGTLHGGALVVLLDETMCAAADNQSRDFFVRLHPSLNWRLIWAGWCVWVDYAFTATMTTKFLKPVKLPGVVMVRSRVVKVEGRKIYVRGSIEDGDGNLMAESEAMLVDKTPGKRSNL
ncbi:HotDog domain-containing protein [Chaetomidium leptoderma]|uniref:HotDog domain-containing protein n=1 Tax=Chaetomidium leptoderma TaxID=669021 RepID=A0AAN6ZW08_9PEZI|nr:HotDog domain-containing protein [Chaetomidium leptoderma]